MVEENTHENELDNIIVWKNFRINELKTIDILQIVDSILSYELMYNKEYSNKWKNNRRLGVK